MMMKGTDRGRMLGGVFGKALEPLQKGVRRNPGACDPALDTHFRFHF